MLKAGFLHELRRRHVVRVAIAYAVAAWVLVQLGATVFPIFGAPAWVLKVFVALLALGFPVAVILAWAFEMTPDGMRRSEPAHSDDARPHAQTHRVGKSLNTVIIAVLVLVLAVAVLAWRQFMFHPAPATLVATAQPVAAPASASTTTAPEKSIAVLPLLNESGDSHEQFFSDGLSEDLITALSQFAGLKVIGRNSAFQFRNTKDDSATIGAKLGVAHLLEGSVRRAGDTVRISAELINANDGSTLWSQHYDRPYQDLFVLQDDITKAVSTALKAKLLSGDGAVIQSDRPPSGNLDAYTAYLQGKFYDANNTEADDLKAIDFYNDAIRLDPRYADAYAGLSHAWTSHAAQFLSGADMKQAYAKAHTAADTALTLDPNSASAHLARAYLLQSADFDWTAADSEFRRALHIAPENGGAKFMWSVLLATLGKPAPAVRLTQEALASDPLHASWYGWLAQYLLPLGRFDEAETAIRRAIALQPQAVGQYETLTTIEVQRGDAKAALRAAQQEPPGIWRDVALAVAIQIGPDRAAADAALKNLIDKQAGNGPYQIAEVYALRKAPDKIFEWLDRAWANRDPGISSLLFDPFLLRYKDDPRFAAFCRKVGLPTTTTTTAKAMP